MENLDSNFVKNTSENLLNFIKQYGKEQLKLKDYEIKKINKYFNRNPFDQWFNASLKPTIVEKTENSEKLTVAEFSNQFILNYVRNIPNLENFHSGKPCEKLYTSNVKRFTNKEKQLLILNFQNSFELFFLLSRLFSSFDKNMQKILHGENIFYYGAIFPFESEFSGGCSMNDKEDSIKNDLKMQKKEGLPEHAIIFNLVINENPLWKKWNSGK